MAGPFDCDPAMLELFRAEMDTHVPVLSEGLLALEKGQAGEKDLEAMMRAAHSIKGAARIVGIEAAVRVSHAMEDCFLAAKGHRITLTSEAVDVLLRGVDTLQRICSPQPDPEMNEQSIEALLNQITAVMEGRLTAQSGERTAESPVSATTVRPATSATQPPDRSLTLPAAFDDSAAESLRVDLSAILRNRPSRIRINFGQVQHVSAAALALLVSFAREITRSEPAPRIDAEGISVAMAGLLRTTGLDGTFLQSE
jgi:two-component system sensor histidine kinase and response regulator WspE